MNSARMLSLSLLAVLGVPVRASAASIVTQSCPRQADNTMRYDCTVDLTASDSVRVGYRLDTGGPWRWSEWRTGDPVTITLYGFNPDAMDDYEYKVELLAGSGTGAIPLSDQPELPTALADLDLSVTRNAGAASNFVMFDTPDCEFSANYLVAVNTTAGHIAWYQDIDAATGLPGATVTGWSWTDDGTILAVIDQRYIYEWAFDGYDVVTPVDLSGNCSGAAGDTGPCPHHDAFRYRPTGKTYVITGAADTSVAPSATADFNYYPCNALDGFVEDAVRIYDSTFGSYSDHSVIDDMGFDPSTDGGPNLTCATSYWQAIDAPYYPVFATSDLVADWTHTNSVSAFEIGGTERVTHSLREWSEIVRYDPDSTTVEWVLKGIDPAYSDFAVEIDASVSGADDFGGQHHVTPAMGGLLMFDNRSPDTSDLVSRAIQLDIDTSAWEATIVKSWELREPGSPWDPIDCSMGLGSAVIVPGTTGNNVLATCGPEATIEEIGEYDGDRTTDPLVYITVDDSDGDFCSSMAGTGPNGPMKWYRAWPLLSLGEF